MAGADDGDFGALEGAHTGEISPDPARVAKVGATAATVEAAVRDLAAGAAQPEPLGQASLMLDEMDEQMALFAGPVRHVADAIAGARGRGRPKGSTNKNSFRDVLLRMGYRHPGLNLAALANADPVQLAQELSTDKLDAMQLILKANAELMPYFEGKAATKIEVEGGVMHMMVIGELPTEQRGDGQVLDITNVEKPD